MKPLAPQPAVPKVATGIAGFDEITEGGLPRGRTTLVVGGAGCGKTVFALQSLVDAARRKESGIFVAFEESALQITANAATFGWDLPRLAKNKLFFLDARLAPEVVKSGDFDLLGMLNLLRLKAVQLGATCIVFDGLDVLLSLLDDPQLERREMYRIRDWLAETGLTAIITQKAGQGDADGRYAFLQFMVDCVIVVRHQVVEGSAFRTLRVVKYRGSGFLGDEFPISLTAADAMQLTTRGPSALEYEVTDERVSSGVERLDNMLRGGYHRGSNVLISGAPGTAKSTLSGLFAAAACARGERTLYVSFDEGAAQIVRNLRSVSVNFAPYLKSGLLKMYSTRTRGPNVEDQFGALRRLVCSDRPKCLVIDPLSALSTKLAHIASADAAQQFLDFLKGEGVTVVNTSLLEGVNTNEATATGISTIADTWIHLSYHVQDGERNRALTIVKSRGTGHSNQVRELELTDDGVTLSDVFAADGKVLMGVARWQWERKERAEEIRGRAATELRRIQLELAQAEAEARLQVIQAEMEARRAELSVLVDASGTASKVRRADRAVLRGIRVADSTGRTEAPEQVPAARGTGRRRRGKPRAS